MAAIAFDEATHTYWINGTKVPGVTELLKESGVARGIEFVGEDALWRGKEIHKAIHFFHKGTLDWDSVPAEIRPYLHGYLQFLKETGFCPMSWEKKVAIPVLGFAGCYDVEGMRGAERWLIDFKSSVSCRTIAPWVGVQLAGYDMAMGPCNPPRRRFGLKLLENGLYNLQAFVDPSDYTVMMGCINIHNWRVRHERK